MPRWFIPCTMRGKLSSILILLELLMLEETALVNVHREMGGKLVDFGGWNMPLHYGSQIEEHNWVRSDAGMFDVSHMTVVDIADAGEVNGEANNGARVFLRYLLANDVDKLKLDGKALYSGMLNTEGGVIDDLIVYKMAFGYRLVVNCATREKDLAWINKQAQAYAVTVSERPEMAMIAVQGPNARAKVHQLLNAEAIESLAVFQGAFLNKAERSDWFVARTGYTGEDGYEIMLPQAQAEGFWRELRAAGVAPCGLGARDTLRLEAGMNLYGHEMDEQTSPLVANMGWTVAWQPEDRDFIGRAVLEAEKAVGVSHKLVGLVLTERGVLREGQQVTLANGKASANDTDALETGVITSGTFSPTLGYSIALARVPVSFSGEVCVQVRNKLLPVALVKPCFVRNGQKVF